MKKTKQKRFQPDNKQVRISAFFSALEKPSESKHVTYTEESENRKQETVKDNIHLKCHSPKSEVSSDGICRYKTKSPLQELNNCVNQSSPIHENNSCVSDGMKTVTKANSLNLDFIYPTPDNIIHINKARNVDIRRMKRKLTFTEVNNVDRKNKTLKCIFNDNLDRNKSSGHSVLIDIQEKELELKHMDVSSDGIVKFSNCEALINDECKSTYEKNLTRLDSNTAENSIIFEKNNVRCATSGTQIENVPVNRSSEFELGTCVQHNILDSKCVNNSGQLDLVENTNMTCAADFVLNNCAESNVNIENVTSHVQTEVGISRVTETEAGEDTSHAHGSEVLKNGLKLDTPMYCKVICIEHLVHEVLLDMQACCPNSVSFKCLLRGLWVNIKINIGDHVLVTATLSTDEPKYWVIDNDSGLIILYPDILLSGTSVVGSLFCMRRSVLSSMFRGLDTDSRGMVIGTLLHRILQQVLKQQVGSVEEIEKIVTEILLTSESVFSLYASKMTLEETRRELDAFVPRIYSFLKTYLYVSRSSDYSELRDTTSWEGEITSVADIEENIWVPRLGLKGKVDVTVKTRTGSKEKLMPLELKTGKASFSAEHCGQVILYIMMMNELGYSVDSGLLLYLREGVMKEISVGHSEYRDLISLRNELIYYLQASQHIYNADNGRRIVSPLLPEPINHHSACTKCPYLTVCSSALIDNGLDQLPENNLLYNLSKKATSHLKQEHINYVFHWVGLLQMEHKEVQYMGSKISDIWFLSPAVREKNGSCLANVTVVGTAVEISSGHYEQVFFSMNMSKCSFVEGDYIIVSTDTRAAVAGGTIICICDNYITLDLERDLSGRGEKNWHLDKYVSHSLRIFNISNLGFLLDNTEQAARLRQAIISLELPKFAAKLSSKVLKLGSDLLQPLNSGQKSAVFQAFAAEHYVLFKGMPGTGKTATVICLIRLAVRLGSSVLITSHTHSAIDNILLRLKGKVDFIRLGSSRKIHPELLEYSEEKHNCSDPSALEKFYNSKPVVAVTCFGCGHSLLRQRQFDICVVDEATQVLQPTVLRALFSAKKFILVGDPDQLPPLVKSSEASKLGLRDSLFARLDRPAVTAVLCQQYRMNETITCVANSLTYNGKLECANDTVSKATLQINKQVTYPAWLNAALSTSIEDSVIVLDTCVSESAPCSNKKEVDIILKILTAFRQGGITDNQIGIIAPYRAQVLLLRNAQKNADLCVEVNTVDQYQGRDKDIIIYSCTQTDKAKVKETCILGDKNRMTVAVTRARYKLIIIGSVQTLQCYSVFQKLFHSIPKNKFLSLLQL